MRKLFQNLKSHIHHDFQAGYYISTAIFLTACICINYYFDFEDSIIDGFRGQHIRILFYFLFYGFAYYAAILIMVNFKKGQRRLLKKKSFWFKSGFILAVLAIDGAFHYHETIVNNELSYQLHYWAKKVLKNLISIFTVLIPLIVYYKIADQKQQSFYGLTVKGFDHKPYLLLLLLMLPIILAASSLDNFSEFYPNYKANPAYRYFEVPQWIPAIIYEVAYGWDFIMTELVFRGFMVIGLGSLLGRNAIMPMVVTYCFLHFGKPEGEAISSIFGGYILGIIAFESKSIFGGVILHIGVAWLMELVAWLQQILRYH